MPVDLGGSGIIFFIVFIHAVGGGSVCGLSCCVCTVDVDHVASRGRLDLHDLNEHLASSAHRRYKWADAAAVH